MAFQKAYRDKAITTDELAVVYASLILADDDIPITEDKINTILGAAEVKVEPIWPALFSKALQSLNVKELITSIGAGAGGGGTGGGPATGGAQAEATPAVEEKKPAVVEEDEDDSDDDMGLSLFD